MSRTRWIVATMALVAAAAACGGDDDSGGAGDTSGPDGTATPTTETAGGGSGEGDGGESQGAGDAPESGVVGDQADAEPTDGGVLSIAGYAEPSGLDPTVAVGNGVGGGIELAAIYDTLMRYEPESNEYEPQLAQGLESNDDGSQFTLTLREGVTFSDGTPLNAEAVVTSMQRHVDNSSRYAPVVSMVDEYRTPDDQTVVFELTEPWPGFPYVLSTSPGMITSPTAIAEMGDEAFSGSPVGAGPFTVERYAPGEELQLTAREDYWNGRPHLDGVRFVNVSGADTQLDAIRSGELDAAFMREPTPVAEARDDGYPGYLNHQNLGSVVLINHTGDRPTADVRVRRAIALAIDPEVLNQRADQGNGHYSHDVLNPASQYYDAGLNLEYDPERAAELVQEVKDETGWDGSIEVACSNIPSRENWALALGGLLDAVGFQSDVVSAGPVADLIQRVNAEGNFDLACWGYNVDNASPYEALSLHLHSESPQNATGYSSDKMDAVIEDLRAAQNVDERTAVLNELQALFDEDVPVVPTASVPEFFVWDKDVHGIKPSVKTMVLLDEAFIAE